jgi:hypothetical protein
MVPVPLKIIKILTQELSSQSVDPDSSFLGNSGAVPNLENDLQSDDEDEGGDWEDLPTIDLGNARTREELMSFADGSGGFLNATRRQDDETQMFLIDFFRGVGSGEGRDRFEETFKMLTEEEQGILRGLFGA